MSDGTQKIWLNGHGGSIDDPFTTMDYYTSKYWAPIGEPTSLQLALQECGVRCILEQMAA